MSILNDPNFNDYEVKTSTFTLGLLEYLIDNNIISGGPYRLTEKGKLLFEMFLKEQFVPHPDDLKKMIEGVIFHFPYESMVDTSDPDSITLTQELSTLNEAVSSAKEICDSLDSAIDLLVSKNQYYKSKDLLEDIKISLEYLLLVD